MMIKVTSWHPVLFLGSSSHDILALLGSNSAIQYYQWYAGNQSIQSSSPSTSDWCRCVTRKHQPVKSHQTDESNFQNICKFQFSYKPDKCRVWRMLCDTCPPSQFLLVCAVTGTDSRAGSVPARPAGVSLHTPGLYMSVAGKLSSEHLPVTHSHSFPRGQHNTTK